MFGIFFELAEHAQGFARPFGQPPPSRNIPMARNIPPPDERKAALKRGFQN